MRNLSAGAITELANSERVIEASLTIRDERLRFADQRSTQVDYVSGDLVLAYDDCVYSSNVLRVAVVKDGSNYELWYNYIDDFGAIWDNWTDMSIALAENSRPAVFGGRVIYLKSNYELAYKDWNGTVWSSETVIETIPGTPTADVAMVSTDIFYLHYTPGSTSNHGFIIRKSVSSAFADQPWSGRTIGADFYGAFDAVSYDTGIEYVYFSDNDGDRAWGMRLDTGGIFGRPFPVVPLDIVDTTSKFIMGHASMIDGECYVTGILKRPGGFSMHIYMRGPEKFSMGRDMFIAQANDETKMYTYGDATTIEYDPIPGQIHVVSDEVWYLGPLLAWKAPATMYVGYNNTALETTLATFSNMQIGDGGNGSKKLSFMFDPNITHAAIREGSIIEVTVTINSEDIDMGTFVIDTIAEAKDVMGIRTGVMARSKASKALDGWASDADFDFWGQTAAAARPYDLAEVIRAEGLWEQETVAVGNVISLPFLNQQGILYTSAHSGMGTIAQGMFYYPDTADYEPSYGVICNYAHQRWEATGLELHENSARMGHWGIGVIFELDAHSGSPGVRVTHFYEDSVEDITTFALSIPGDTWHWLRARYEFGHLIIDYRLDASTDWTRVGELVICYDSEDSTYHGLTVETVTLGADEETERGRAALYIKNITAYSPSYGLSSSGLILGVDDNSFAEVADNLLIDREVVLIGSKSANTTPTSNTDVVEGFTFPSADHWDNDPDGFTGYEIYLDGTAAVKARNAYNDHALVVVSGPGEGRTFTICEYDYEAPDQWIDSGGPYTAPDKWTDHVGDLAYGAWAASVKHRVFVTENPSGAISAGSVVRIVPSFTVTRAQASTEATTHISGINASFYKDNSIYCRDFNYFTTEPEYSIADMASEITNKAGAGSVSAPNRLTNQAKATSGWDLQVEIAATEQTARSFVAHFDLNDPDTAGGFGIAFALLKDEYDVYSDGRIIMIYEDRVDYFEYVTPTPTLIESYDLDIVYDSGPSTISVHDEFVSVYIHGKHIHTFVDRDVATIQADEVVPVPQWYAGVVLHNTCDVDPLWTEVSQRCDNYVLVMGTQGGSLLTGLLGEQRIYFTDAMDGALRMFTDRVIINSGSAVDFLLDENSRQSEDNLFTRLRIEGAEVSEQFDTEAIIEHGNIFALANSSELIEYDDHYREALNLLEEATFNAVPISVSGLADPRVEANDIFIVDDGTEKTILVDGVSFSFDVAENQVQFVMNIEGRHGD